jgi:hypothetical protein
VKLYSGRITTVLQFISKGELQILRLKPARSFERLFTGISKNRNTSIFSPQHNVVWVIHKLTIMQIKSDSKKNKAFLQVVINCALKAEEYAFASVLNAKEAAGVPRPYTSCKEVSEICFRLAKQILERHNFSRDLLVSCARICTLCAADCRSCSGDISRQCRNACEECAEACYSELYKIIALKKKGGLD